MEKELQIVGFRIGSEDLWRSHRVCRELSASRKSPPFPSAPDLIEGVINLRGNYSGDGPSQRFGSAPTQPTRRIASSSSNSKQAHRLIVSSASEC